MLSFTNLALRRGPNLLFEDVSFVIHRDKKVGLIGANGAGKTSLFKMITGELDVDDGNLDSSTATVSITTTLVNDAPTADNQTVEVNEQTTKEITLTEEVETVIDSTTINEPEKPASPGSETSIDG